MQSTRLGPVRQGDAEPLRLFGAWLNAWPPLRWALGAAVAAGTLALLLPPALPHVDPGVINGAPLPTWWTYPVIGAAAVLTGLSVATFLRAPAGAQPVVCDLRWPVLGLLGTALATGASGGGAFGGFLAGSPGSPADLTGAVLAISALATLGYGLVDRFRREQAATRTSGEDALVCTTCRPLFPARTPRNPNNQRNHEGE